jgi:hypothetical protein
MLATVLATLVVVGVLGGVVAGILIRLMQGRQPPDGLKILASGIVVFRRIKRRVTAFVRAAKVKVDHAVREAEATRSDATDEER